MTHVEKVSVQISIDVPNLADAIRFYTAAFGFTKFSAPAPGVAVLHAGNMNVCLLERFAETLNRGFARGMRVRFKLPLGMGAIRMGKPYSDDLRERAVQALEAGYSRVEVAELYSLSLSSIGRFIRRKRETGSVSPDKFGGYKRSALEPHADLVCRLVTERPDSTLLELQARLAKEKVMVSQTAIFRFLRHLKLTFKKSPPGLRARSARRRCSSQSLT